MIKITRMFTFKDLSFLLTVCISLNVSLVGQVTNNVNPQKEIGFDRKSNFNLEELKVRWKKAALENCPGVPCTIVSPPPLPPSFTCGTTTVSDVDDNIYNTVLIGTQCWTKQNLRVKNYNDGSAIKFDASGGTTGDVGETWSVQTAGAFTLYEHDSTSTPSNLTKYGYLYNWFAVSDVRNICPMGWRVPSDSDWNKLVIFADATADTTIASLVQSNTAAIKLMSQSLWSAPIIPGTDVFEFSLLPGGARYPGTHGGTPISNLGQFIDESIGSFHWTSTIDSSVSPPLAYFRTILDVSASGHSFIRSTEAREGGGSIRCIKN